MTIKTISVELSEIKIREETVIKKRCPKGIDAILASILPPQLGQKSKTEKPKVILPTSKPKKAPIEKLIFGSFN
jgi:hypothetical protein